MSTWFYTNVQTSGNNILYRGYRNGVREQKKVGFSPTLYVSSKTQTQYRTIEGEYVEPVKLDSIDNAREFVDRYDGVRNFSIYGNTDWAYQYISDLYPEHQEIEYDQKLLRIINVDIETECEDGFSSPKDARERINVITVRCGDKRYVMALNAFVLADTTIDQRIFSDEKDMLEHFIDLWCSIDPDIITGWNVRFYDIPYLVNRIIRLFGKQGVAKAKKLSPWSRIKETTVEFNNKPNQVFLIYGVDILDYLELYKKYSPNKRESYKLDHIAEVELGKKKIDYSEYDHIRDFYQQNFQKFVEYNVVDVDLVAELDQKLNLLGLHISMAYLAKTNYNDVFGQVRMWDCIIYNHLRKQNIVIPPKVKKNKTEQYKGAAVKEPIIGFHDWIVSYDVASLYPHLILQYNISPDTIVDEHSAPKYSVDTMLSGEFDTSYVKERNYAMAANGAVFVRDKLGFLPELMTKFYNQRKHFKKLETENKKKLETNIDDAERTICKRNVAMYGTMQMAYKIALNSAYGAIGNEHFRYFDLRQAEAITVSGQLAIRWIQKKLNEYLNKQLKTNNHDYIIASDTDSVYLNLSNAVKLSGIDTTIPDKVVTFLDKFCRKALDPFIEASFQELATKMNAYAQRMEMKREAIADRGLWKAKKMYCLNVYDNEGVRKKTPELKIMGIETQRSSTPAMCREHLKKCIHLMLTKDEATVQQYIANFKKQFFSSSVKDVAIPRSANKMDVYADKHTIYRKGTPCQVKAALIHNAGLVKLGLDKFYAPITNGDKIKYVHLREPNPFGQKVIAFIGNPPREFELEKYIDYREHYQRTFLTPLETLMQAANWSPVARPSLSGFFG